MTSIEYIFMILICLYSFIALIIAYMIIRMIGKYIDKKIDLINAEEAYNTSRINKLDSDNRLATITYTNELLKFIRSIIAQIAVVKFRTFTDSKDLTKVTRKNVTDVVADVAIETNLYISRDELAISSTLLTPDFLNKYIVENSVIIVKDLFKKVIEDYEQQKELGLL